MARKSAPAATLATPTTEDAKMPDTVSIHPDVQLIDDYRTALEVVEAYNKRRAQVVAQLDAQSLKPTNEVLEGVKQTVATWLNSLGMRPRELAGAKRAINMDAYTFGGGSVDAAPEFVEHLAYTAPDNQSMTPVYSSVIAYIKGIDEALPEDERYFLETDIDRLNNLFFPRPTNPGTKRAALKPEGDKDVNSWTGEYRGHSLLMRIKPDGSAHVPSGRSMGTIALACMREDGKAPSLNKDGKEVANREYLDAITKFANDEAKRLGKVYIP